MPKLDLTGLIPQHTLEIDVAKFDGTAETWVIPPFDNETEHFYWQWQQSLLERRRQEQEKALDMSSDPVELARQTTAEIAAPLVAAVVKNVKLDPEKLVKEFPGIVLSRVAAAVTGFFLSGELPTWAGSEQTENENSPEKTLNSTTAA